MVKRIMLAGLLMALMASPSLPNDAASEQLARPCLHGLSEQPRQQARREQAIRVAQQINQVQHRGPAPAGREYRPLEELRDVPSVPAGFRLQFHTDGATYMFSLKDNQDSCQFAIFSDQDEGIYAATPRMGARIVPAEAR